MRPNLSSHHPVVIDVETSIGDYLLRGMGENNNQLNLKAKASCRRPQTYKTIKNDKNKNRQKHIIFEGFRQNGLHH